ncbi:hypothetical protein EOL94_03150 [bacterium]|nr:hypothetical protein [bacterium]
MFGKRKGDLDKANISNPEKEEKKENMEKQENPQENIEVLKNDIEEDLSEKIEEVKEENNEIVDDIQKKEGSNDYDVKKAKEITKKSENEVIKTTKKAKEDIKDVSLDDESRSRDSFLKGNDFEKNLKENQVILNPDITEDNKKENISTEKEQEVKDIEKKIKEIDEELETGNFKAKGSKKNRKKDREILVKKLDKLNKELEKKEEKPEVKEESAEEKIEDENVFSKEEQEIKDIEKQIEEVDKELNNKNLKNRDIKKALKNKKIRLERRKKDLEINLVVKEESTEEKPEEKPEVKEESTEEKPEVKEELVEEAEEKVEEKPEVKEEPVEEKVEEKLEEDFFTEKDLLNLFEEKNIKKEDLEKVNGFSELDLSAQKMVFDFFDRICLEKAQDSIKREEIDEINKKQTKLGKKSAMFKNIFKHKKREKAAVEKSFKEGFSKESEAELTNLVEAFKSSEIKSEFSSEGEIVFDFIEKDKMGDEKFIESLEGKDVLGDLNKKANVLANTPKYKQYESKKAKANYEKAQKEYEDGKKALEKALKSMGKTDKEILQSLIDIDSKVNNVQFMADYPDLNQEWLKMKDGKLKRLFNSIGSGGLKNIPADKAKFFIGGAVARQLSKIGVAAVVGTATTATALASFAAIPLTAAGIGAARGRHKGKKEILESEKKIDKKDHWKDSKLFQEKSQERKKNYDEYKKFFNDNNVQELLSKRKNDEDTLNEDEKNLLEKNDELVNVLRQKNQEIFELRDDNRSKIERATFRSKDLSDKLDFLINKIESNKKNKEYVKNNLNNDLNTLKRRIEFTTKKSKDNLINFGNSKENLNNNFNFSKKLAEAQMYLTENVDLIDKNQEYKVMGEEKGGSLEFVKVDANKRAEKLLNYFEEIQGSKLKKERKEHIKKAMIRGAKTGAIFSAAGAASMDFISGDGIMDIASDAISKTSEFVKEDILSSENLINSYDEIKDWPESLLKHVGESGEITDQDRTLVEFFSDHSDLTPSEQEAIFSSNISNENEAEFLLGEIRAVKEEIQVGSNFTATLRNALKGCNDNTKDAFIKNVNEKFNIFSEETILGDENRDELLKKAVNRLSVEGANEDSGVANLVYEGNILKINSETGDWEILQGSSKFEPKAVELPKVSEYIEPERVDEIKEMASKKFDYFDNSFGGELKEAYDTDLLHENIDSNMGSSFGAEPSLEDVEIDVEDASISNSPEEYVQPKAEVNDVEVGGEDATVENAVKEEIDSEELQVKHFSNEAEILNNQSFEKINENIGPKYESQEERDYVVSLMVKNADVDGDSDFISEESLKRQAGNLYDVSDDEVKDILRKQLIEREYPGIEPDKAELMFRTEVINKAAPNIGNEIFTSRSEDIFDPNKVYNISGNNFCLVNRLDEITKIDGFYDNLTKKDQNKLLKIIEDIQDRKIFDKEKHSKKLNKFLLDVYEEYRGQ